MLTCTNIYITVMPNNLMFCDRCFMYSILVVMHTIEFTCDSWNFPKRLFYPIICMYFQFYPLCFYDFWHILISYWVHFFHIIFSFMLHVCIFCTNQLQYITLVHIQWCTVYVIYIRYIYIWDIYISINFYCTIHFTSCSYCQPKNHTQVHHWYMSWNE